MLRCRSLALGLGCALVALVGCDDPPGVPPAPPAKAGAAPAKAGDAPEKTLAVTPLKRPAARAAPTPTLAPVGGKVAPAGSGASTAPPAEGSPEPLAAVLERYRKLAGRDNGTEGHPLGGLTMHRRTVLVDPSAPFNVRVGEEAGLATAHELRAFFQPANEGAALKVLAQLLPAALGQYAGHAQNVETLVRVAIGDRSSEDCKAARLGPYQLVTVFQPERLNGNHELAVLLGDTRATGQSSRKLLGMLEIKALKCTALRLKK